jgi:hypothetical protein
MATYTWEYGAAGTGLHFTIVYDTVNQTFTVESLEGSFDLNALWWNDGVDDGSGVTLSKADNSLNMNGTNEDWDGMAKLSSAGLGSAGETKNSFISAGETAEFSLASFGITGDFDVENGGTLGVRATSVNGGGSIKLVDDNPVFTPPEGPPPPPDHFPPWDAPAISHITLYWRDDATLVDDKPSPTGDGWFTVKFDYDFDDPEFPLTDDLDNDLGALLDFLVAQGDITEAHKDSLVGVAIKGGTTETWYDLDNVPSDTDTPPGDIPDFPLANNEVDQAYEWDATNDGWIIAP